MRRRVQITRRAWLAAAAGAAGCGRTKGRGYPGFAFVANEESRSVAAVDLTRFHMRRAIAMDGRPGAVLAHSTRPVAYALIPENGGVHEISSGRLRVERRARAGASAYTMRLTPDGDYLWVLEPRSLVCLRLSDFTITGHIRLPGTPEDFDVNRDGTHAAVSFPRERTAGLFDLHRGKQVWLAGAGSDPRIIRFQSDGRRVLVGNRSERMLTILDSAGGRVATRLPLALEPMNFAFKSDGGELYITGAGMDAVVIVFPYNLEVEQTILAGKSPDGMAVLDNPSYLFVANPETGDVTVLDMDTRKLAATVRAGQQPRRIVLTPDGQYALVLNQQSGDLAVIWLGALRGRRHGHVAPLFTMVPVGLKPVSAAVVRA